MMRTTIGSFGTWATATGCLAALGSTAWAKQNTTGDRLTPKMTKEIQVQSSESGYVRMKAEPLKKNLFLRKCCSGLRAWNTDQCLYGGQGGGRAQTSICRLANLIGFRKGIPRGYPPK